MLNWIWPNNDDYFSFNWVQWNLALVEWLDIDNISTISVFSAILQVQCFKMSLLQGFPLFCCLLLRGFIDLLIFFCFMKSSSFFLKIQIEKGMAYLQWDFVRWIIWIIWLEAKYLNLSFDGWFFDVIGA